MDQTHKPSYQVNKKPVSKATPSTDGAAGIEINRAEFIKYIQIECSNAAKTELTTRTITEKTLETIAKIANKSNEKGNIWKMIPFKVAVGNIFGNSWEQVSLPPTTSGKTRGEKHKILEKMLTVLINQINPDKAPETEPETSDEPDFVKRFLKLLNQQTCKILKATIAAKVNEINKIASPSEIEAGTKPCEKSSDHLPEVSPNAPPLQPDNAFHYFPYQAPYAMPFAPDNAAGYFAPPPPYPSDDTPPQQVHPQHPAVPALPPPQQQPAADTTPARAKPVAEPITQEPSGDRVIREKDFVQMVARMAKLNANREDASKSKKSSDTLGTKMAYLQKDSEASVGRLGRIWPLTIKNQDLSSYWRPTAGTKESVTCYLEFIDISKNERIPVYDTAGRLAERKKGGDHRIYEFKDNFMQIIMDKFGGKSNVTFEHPQNFFYQYGKLVTSDKDERVKCNIRLMPSVESLEHFPERTKIGGTSVRKTRGETVPFQLLFSRLLGDKAVADTRDPKFAGLFGHSGWHNFSSGGSEEALKVSPFTFLTYSKALDDALEEAFGERYFESPENVAMLAHASMQGYEEVEDQWMRSCQGADESDFGRVELDGAGGDLETDSAEPTLKSSAILADDTILATNTLRRIRSTHFMVGPVNLMIISSSSGNFNGPSPKMLIDKFK